MTDKNNSPRAWVAFEQTSGVKAKGKTVAGPALDFSAATVVAKPEETLTAPSKKPTFD